MDSIGDNLAVVLAVLAMVAIAAGAIGGILYALHFMLTLPMRRAERARLFLDILEIAIDRGQRVEEGLIFISKRRGNVWRRVTESFRTWRSRDVHSRRCSSGSSRAVATISRLGFKKRRRFFRGAPNTGPR